MFVNQLKELEQDFGLLTGEESALINLFGDSGNLLSLEAQTHNLMLYNNIDEDDLLLDLHPLAFCSKSEF